MGLTYSLIIPPSPTLTETNLPNQKGKIFLVTGGYGGVGLALSKILYDAGAKVYIAGRNLDAGRKAVNELKERKSPSAGEVDFLHVDLSNLESVRAAADAFKTQETRLDVLWQNAGISLPPSGSTSKQGYELALATNVLGPFLLYQLLSPCLEKGAETTPEGSVRVVWTGSIAVDFDGRRGGFTMAEINQPGRNVIHQLANYGISKIANWFLADALSKESKAGSRGVLHVVQNPGNLRTGLLKDRWIVDVLSWPLRYDARYGAYTELWAGLSTDLGADDGGVFILPWGRRHPSPREDLLNAMKSKEEGGTGLAADLLEWCWEQTKEYRSGG